MLRKLQYAAVVLLLLAIAIPWSVTGPLDAFQWLQIVVSWVALALVPFRVRLACDIGAFLFLSVIGEAVVSQLADWGDWETLSDPGLFFALQAWATGSAVALFVMGVRLERVAD